MTCAIWTNSDDLGSAVKRQLNASLAGLSDVAVLPKEALPAAGKIGQSYDLGILHLNSNDETILNDLNTCCEHLPVLIFLIEGHCRFLSGIQAASLDYFQWPSDTRKLKLLGGRMLELHFLSAEKPSFVQEYRKALRFMVSQKLKRIFEHIIIPHASGYALHKTDSLMRFEREGPFCYVFSADGQQILAEKSIDHFEDVLLHSGFVRINNEQLINLKYLRKWSGVTGVKIILADNSVYAVSLRRVPLFLEAFAKWSTKDAQAPGNNKP